MNRDANKARYRCGVGGELVLDCTALVPDSYHRRKSISLTYCSHAAFTCYTRNAGLSSELEPSSTRDSQGVADSRLSSA